MKPIFRVHLPITFQTNNSRQARVVVFSVLNDLIFIILFCRKEYDFDSFLLQLILFLKFHLLIIKKTHHRSGKLYIQYFYQKGLAQKQKLNVFLCVEKVRSISEI